MKENMEKKDEFEDDAVKIWKRIHEERAMTSDVAMIKAALRQAHARGQKETFEWCASAVRANTRYKDGGYLGRLFTLKAAAITEGK